MKTEEKNTYFAIAGQISEEHKEKYPGMKISLFHSAF
jgi:hypothetical protein